MLDVHLEEPEYANSGVESVIRDFEKGVAEAGLRRLFPCIEALLQRCAAAKASTEATAAEVVPGLTAFAPALPRGGERVLAVSSGGHRFAVAIIPGPDGKPRALSIARWKPEIPAALAASLAQAMPCGPDQAVVLAKSITPFAAPGSDFHINDICARACSNKGQTPFSSTVMTARLRMSDPAASVQVGVRQNVGRGVLEFFEAMAPALPLAPGLAGKDADIFGSHLANSAVRADGGYPGPVCRSLSEHVRSRGFVELAKAGAPLLAENHALMQRLGYSYGQKALKHSDYDRVCFAVPAADPDVLAFVHHNIDLMFDVNRYLVVLRKDEAGGIGRVECHLVHWPQSDVNTSSHGMVEDLDGLGVLADDLHVYADPDGTPPRLDLARYAELLRTGQPLPTPAVGADLRTGVALPGTAFDTSGAIHYLHHIHGTDGPPLKALAAGEDPGDGTEDTTNFDDGRLPEDEPGAAPGLGR